MGLKGFFMEDSPQFVDKTLQCKDCQNDFIFSAGEQKFFAEKDLKNLPARCPDCRQKRKVKEQDDIAKYQIVCAQCGKKSKAPFEVDVDATFFCQHCFEIVKRKEEKDKQKMEPTT